MSIFVQDFKRTRDYNNVKADQSIAFIIQSNFPLAGYDPTPDSYDDPAKGPMKDALRLSDNAKKGAWYLAKCTFDEKANKPTKNKYYPVFFPLKNNNPVTNKYVAAPCPPFCDGNTDG